MTATVTVTGLADLQATPQDATPGWLAAARRSAAAWVSTHGFPTRKNEDWRYLRLAPILGTPFEPAPDRADDGRFPPALDGLSPDLGGVQLTFVNGHLATGMSSMSAVPGATITGVAATLARDPGSLEGQFADPEEAFLDGFAALNVALAADGAYIDIPANTAVDAPIHLVFFTIPGNGPLISSPRSIVNIGHHSTATIVETHVGFGEIAACTNAVTRVTLAEGAQVDHYIVQDLPTSAFHLNVLDVVQSTDSQFTSRAFSLGSAIARHEVRVLLAGERATTTLDGLYLPSGEQQLDNPVMVEHRAPNCTSTQHYNGVIDGHGHGVFNGRIVVQPSGAGADARQSNRNLVLSNTAEIDTRPRLEIFADDVACVHGATVGQLDAEAIHYLRTRGIDEQTARGLLTGAFANEMVERITLDPLREWTQRAVSSRLGHAQEGSQ